MENLGDWLYIILLVIAGISGLLSSGRKKKQQQQAAPRRVDPEPYYEEEQTPQQPKSFWDILEEVQNEGGSVFPVEPVKQPQTPKPSNLPKPPKSHYVPIKEQKLEEDDPFFIPSGSFHDTEELKKAIIYTEILNRKY